jgi:hypothetical protein
LNGVCPAYAATRKLPGRIHKAAVAIRRCRTAALGAHAQRCPAGHVTHVRCTSCRHRACPTCAGPRAARWLAQLEARLLPTRHYQLVFTIAHELLGLWRYNQQALGEALFRAARQSVLALLAQLAAQPWHVRIAQRLGQARAALAATAAVTPAPSLPAGALRAPPARCCPICGRPLVVVPWIAGVPTTIEVRAGPLPAAKSPLRARWT